jgi:hypothetical protein
MCTMNATPKVAKWGEPPPMDTGLSGHLKTGQMWSVQNRPKEVGRELGCFNLPPLGEASLFSYANCVDHT